MTHIYWGYHCMHRNKRQKLCRSVDEDQEDDEVLAATTGAGEVELVESLLDSVADGPPGASQHQALADTYLPKLVKMKKHLEVDEGAPLRAAPQVLGSRIT